MLIDNLPIEQQIPARNEYNRLKYNSLSGYVCRYFGLYRLYTGEVGMRFIYLLCCLLIIPGLIWWIIDLTQVGKFINNKNTELDQYLYLEYSQVEVE